MTAGLAVSDVVQVSVNLAPLAVPARNFGALCIIGDSTVIDTGERYRQYSNLDQVATDFGTTSPEYLAADLFFSQSPQPSILYIGRWASGPTSGVLKGAQFPGAAATTLMTTLQGVTTGSMSVTVDGTAHALSALDFHAITNMNGAASVIAAALTQATVVWDSSFNRFVITSKTTGDTSSISYASSTGAGTDVSATLGLTAASGASAPVAGIAAETPVQAVTTIAGLNSDIYGMTFATDATITDTEHLDVASYIEGAAVSHIYGITTQEPAAIDPTSNTDIGSLLMAAGYSRTVWQYSSSSPYAVASLLGRAFTVDFTANNTVITLMFKQEPGVTAETLNETQAAALKTKHGNVFVNYMNGAAIIQNGVMANGTFFDERHGTDWLQNNVQTRIFNLFYQSPTKIPQTDAGVHQIVAVVEAGLADGVNNGLIAPGVWNSSLEFGQLKTGQTLTKGYYVYAPMVATQSQSDREARKAPTLQAAIKLAGAVHSANVIINVNR